MSSLQKVNACIVFCFQRILVSWAVIIIFCYSPFSSALTKDADQPIHIQADQAEMDQEKEIVTYEGNVEVTQGSLWLQAQKIVVDYKDQKVTRIVATGEPAHYKQEIDQNGKEVSGHSNKIIYHTEEEIIELIGDAYLSEKGNEINSDLITYDIEKGMVNAESVKQEPVKMILQPRSSPSTAN